MSIKHFIQEVEKGLLSPVYFLYANDPYFLKEASAMASMSMPQSDRDFCFNVFDLNDTDEKPAFEQLADVLNTMPFMRTRKIVVIENIQDLPKKDFEKLDIYMSNPSPFSALMLLHEGSPKGQFKDISKKVKTLSLDLRQQDIPVWIKEKARQRGMDITSDAIDYLIGVTGADIGLISSEIEKLTLFCKNRVEVGDLKGLVIGSGDYNVFDLVNALKERNAEKVFRIAKTLLEVQEPYNLIGAINWHYGRMSLSEKGSGAYYKNVFELLNDADIRIKTSGGSAPFEYLLVRLLQI